MAYTFHWSKACLGLLVFLSLWSKPLSQTTRGRTTNEKRNSEATTRSGSSTEGSGFSTTTDTVTRSTGFKDMEDFQNDSVSTTSEPRTTQTTVSHTFQSDKVFLWKKEDNAERTNKVLRGHTFLTMFGTRTTNQCAMECLKSSRCRSFNFDLSANQCSLNNATLEDHPEDTLVQDRMEYHTKQAYSIEKEALGPCGEETCSNHGRCLETRSVDGDLMAICLCDEGYLGTKCQLTGDGAVWSAWMEWSSCSVTCHRGWKRRHRLCEDASTQEVLDSAQCFGADTEYDVCNMKECPRWEEWGQWGECSTLTSCGPGFKARQRSCANGGIVGVDRYCLGLDSETTVCDGPACDGPVRLTNGGAVGEGIIELYDDEEDKWKLLCSDQMTDNIADMICRQAGWPGAHASITDGRLKTNNTNFGLTSVQCSGREKRLMQCTHDKLKTAGTCTNRAQIAAAVQCNVNGAWSLWSAWSECDVTCENGTQTRTRTCDHPPRMHAGMDCEGESVQYKACSLVMCPNGWLEWSEWQCNVSCGDGLATRTRACAFGPGNCVGNDVETQPCATMRDCAVNGVWEEWSDWSECSTTCANGTQYRNRTCLGPFYSGKDCEGDWEETKWCRERDCPIHGEWELWTLWTECSQECGGGLRTRNRTCHGPFNDGDPCEGPADEAEDCNTHACPVDGEWLSWQSWGECSHTCGGGQQQRVRDCKQPLHGGMTCEGNGSEKRTCNEEDCPRDGVWKEWSDWSECSVTCSWGTQWRNRSCEGPFYDGKPCEGNDTDVQECYSGECPVDGHWMEWGSWSDCSFTCGGGSRERSRICYHGKHGGMNCTGSAVEEGTCNDDPCPVDGKWNPWSDWQDCTVSCGNGTSIRYRTCEGPFHGGANCTGPDSEDRSCNTFNCPVDCIMDEWAQWEDCSVTCGGGSRSRERNITGPFYGGTPCEGNATETEDCNSFPCPVDGSWRPWTEWTDCTVTCGTGQQFRERVCDEAMHGGENCTGPSEHYRTCNTHHCPVDGVWEEWSEWDPCSVTCGGGFEYRERNCTGPFYGGKECPGDWNQTRDCNTHNCPVDGYFTQWSPWGACDVTCGGGTKERNRTCIGPFYGGLGCEGPSENITSCNSHECPIDGVLTEWADWSECSLTCGGGVKVRSRNCTGPFYGGLDCEGALEENATCNENPCPEDGQWSPWTEWDECTVTCGGGEQGRNRSCKGILHGGKECEGPTNQTQQCNVHHCPVDGIFEEWSEWSECSLTCGSGSQTRNRTCHGPFYGGLDCDGDFNETQLCNVHDCPIDGWYQDWTAWSFCSVSCGGGIQHRDRICVPPLYGGADCDGPPNESQDCNVQPCPIDGYFEEWSAWSECSLTCGSGSQWKNRTCVPPLYGGKDCEGPLNVTQDCNTQPCPIDGVYLAWSTWSECNTTCGGGLRERVRKCEEPQHGGQDCEGPAAEYISCSENPCPIPGVWFPWTPWTSCTVTCGGGTRQRERECDDKAHGELTGPCEGLAEELVDCHTFDCEPLARTCTEWGERGLMEDTEADIDVDGPGWVSLEPVKVFCDMTSHDGIGITVVGHDQENRHRVQGWEGAREYEVILTYNITFEHAVAVVDQSANCEQYISWECYAALIHNFDNTKVTGWLNRTKGVADYFGGAPPGSDSCACGTNRTCATPNKVCNCDSNDKTWRQDDGYLTYKDDLPVYAFVAGDTGGKNEDGYSSVGPLQCWGTDSKQHAFWKK